VRRSILFIAGTFYVLLHYWGLAQGSHDASGPQLPNAEYDDRNKQNDIDYATCSRKRNEINTLQ
jgi:hypothetical protein